MSALTYIFPFLIFYPTIAAPTGLQGALVGQVPESLNSLVQEVINFLNPHYSPSLKQTIISCLTLLLISIFLNCSPTVRARGDRPRLRYGVAVALHGLLAPDFRGFAALRGAFRDFFYAVAYNLMFRTKDRKKAWTGAHIAFLRRGGFILQEDGRPTHVLRFDNLVHMIKAGQIERPDLSRADILARSIRPSLSRRIVSWLSYFPIYWFINKFTLKLPLVVAFVALHALLTWELLLLRSVSTTGVTEPFAVVQNARELHVLSASEGDISKSEEVVSGALMDLGKDEKVFEEALVTTGEGEKGSFQSNPPSSDENGFTQMRLGVVRLLALPFELIALIFGTLFGLLRAAYSTTKVPLRYQWAVINGPCHLGTIGDYIATLLENFLAWIGFAVLGWHVPFDIERKVWIVASLFLLLQPLVLLLVRPQRIRMRIKESIRQVIYTLYSFVYVVARLSIFFAALYSIRRAL